MGKTTQPEPAFRSAGEFAPVYRLCVPLFASACAVGGAAARSEAFRWRSRPQGCSASSPPLVIGNVLLVVVDHVLHELTIEGVACQLRHFVVHGLLFLVRLGRRRHAHLACNRGRPLVGGGVIGDELLPEAADAVAGALLLGQLTQRGFGQFALDGFGDEGLTGLLLAKAPTLEPASAVARPMLRISLAFMTHLVPTSVARFSGDYGMNDGATA